MKSLSACSALFVCLAAYPPMARASASECPANLPAGLILRVFPDEKLTAGITSGPTILTVASDVRFFPNRPPLLARGSKILGNIVESKKAGRFHGKARARIALTSILTSDFCEYPIDARIVEAGRNKVEEDVVFGRGHAHRDLIALLFPPTTVYQLLRIPGRGPKLVVDSETPLTIKLMQPVSLGEASTRMAENDGPLGALRTRVNQIERDFSTIKSAFVLPAIPPHEKESAGPVSGPCPMQVSSTERPLTGRTNVVRPVRNLTQYHVSISLDRTSVAILPPCYGPSMITTPAREFRLEATASVLTTGGQRQIRMKVIPSADGSGWDIVPDTSEPEAARAN
ncbi:MAG TPA: hypothetical protein VE422_36615 [Terriglobia bacterium]|nr:hypothetical protein [Terriglobia bacterium]